MLYEKKAWHEGEQTRIILIIDFWHPDLSDEEVKFLTLLRNSKMRCLYLLIFVELAFKLSKKLRFEKKLSDDHPDKDNFFSIIESSRDLLTNNDWWQLKEEQKVEN